MKIDIVTDTFPPDVNGVAMTLGRLMEGLRERGHRVHVIRTGLSNGNRETSAASIALPGYKEIRVGLPGPFKFKKRWTKRRPDAIYVATESPLGSSAIKAAKCLGIPVATGFHTNFQDYMERYRLGGLQPAAMAYLRRFHNRADCTITPSPEMLLRLRSEGLREVHLLGRGVDTRLFTPEKRCEALRASWGAGVGSPVAIVVGRIAAEKNLELAISSFARMREAVPDLLCVVVGEGPLRERLAECHRDVKFTGLQTGEDLARHYASADLLLFPSETETFGNVLLEGMASGLVTVSYNYAAAAQHVRHGINGLTAPKGDADAFTQAALEALRRHRESEIKQAARGTAQQLGWDGVIESFEQRLGIIARAATPSQSTQAHKRGKRRVIPCRTVFLSDIHLGTDDSKAAEAVEFLKRLRCEKLVLNGDIIDGWALRRGGRWRGRHTRFIRHVLKMMERDHTEVIYLRGNHDDILERFLPLAFGRLKIAKEHIHHTADGKRYLVVHGDGFDSVSTNHRWLALLGAAGYNFLLRINRVYNRYRA
jgi:glycosyltransferase involved in cell wall biosynthesis